MPSPFLFFETWVLTSLNVYYIKVKHVKQSIRVQAYYRCVYHSFLVTCTFLFYLWRAPKAWCNSIFKYLWGMLYSILLVALSIDPSFGLDGILLELVGTDVNYDIISRSFNVRPRYTSFMIPCHSYNSIVAQIEPFIISTM